MPAQLEVMRSETKYLVSRREAARLADRLGILLMPDAFNGKDRYTVRSLYFDTPDRDDVFDKDVGAFYRKKLRIRIYDTNQQKAKLELKEKVGGIQRKRSLWISREAAAKLSSGDADALLSLNDPFALELYALIKKAVYRPVAVVEYDRQAFTYPLGDVRITFDSNVRANLSNFDLFCKDMQFDTVYPDVVMEVKYTGFLPEFICDILSDHDPVRDSVSKYYLSAQDE